MSEKGRGGFGYRRNVCNFGLKLKRRNERDEEGYVSNTDLK
jgi:hypothetical protein